MMAIKKLAPLSWMCTTGQGHGGWHKPTAALPSPQSRVSSTQCQRSRDSVSTVAKGTGQDQSVGARRSCPLFLSPSWRQEDLANGLGAGNYVLILGFLHYHQLRSAWMAALGNWFSAKQIEMHFVLDHWQQGWILTALWPVKLEPRPSVILRKHEGQLTQTHRLYVRRYGTEE